jgi:biotin carboxyl carrier protein
MAAAVTMELGGDTPGHGGSLRTHQFRIRIGKRWFAIGVEQHGGLIKRVLVDSHPVDVEVEETSSTRWKPAAHQQGVSSSVHESAVEMEEDRRIVSPMPGRVISVAVGVGDLVSDGDELCVVEAMKMEQSMRSSIGGVVKAIHVVPGQNVATGDLLVELE